VGKDVKCCCVDRSPKAAVTEQGKALWWLGWPSALTWGTRRIQYKRTTSSHWPTLAAKVGGVTYIVQYHWSRTRCFE